jgi:hypothetical protein
MREVDSLAKEATRRAASVEWVRCAFTIARNGSRVRFDAG